MSARRIGFLLFDGCLATDVVGPADLFQAAGRLTSESEDPPPYEVVFLGLKTGPVHSWSGLRVHVDHALEDAPELDTIVIPGAQPDARAQLLRTPEVREHLRALAARCRRVASICTGAFVLADLGLLEGRRATTHWRHCAELARHDAVEVQPDALYVEDGAVFTSAGVTAGLDLALALIEADCGRRLALELARLFVVYLKRPGGQSQFSVELAAQIDAPERFDELLAWLRAHLHEPVTVDRLAGIAHMSPRHFARRFAATFGIPPARFVERLRVDRARHLIETTELPLATIATRTGFGEPQTLRRAFRRVLGVNPLTHARHVGHGAGESQRAPGGVTP
ncbi:MAG: GlxA family transcriptional regulator [Pseudomonadales bacterium]|jgi:transcriptional regulator GlxA family with amidase domain|nr:GlxA family transcriptional regulator [Pseudomonadales bacterium]